jgi:ABC-type uncharacterized transport system permease subunit
MTLSVLGFAVATLCYAAASWQIWRVPQQRPRSSGALVLAAVAVHGLAIGARSFHPSGWAIDWVSALNLFAWLASGLLWMLAMRQPVRLLGLVAYPFGVVACCLALVTPVEAVTARQGTLLALHITLSMLSAGLLTLAAVQAGLLALQDRWLHQHSGPALMSRLPPLLTMERMLFDLIAAGFALLSASLLTGFGFIHDWLGQHLAHKTVLSAAAWLIFGGLLVARNWLGMRGRQAARWTLAGYVMLLLAYLGSKWVLEALLGTQWSGA